MWIKDDVAAGIGLCALTQTVGCAITGTTTAEAVIIWCRIPANRCDGGGRCSRCAFRARGCAFASCVFAHGLAVDKQIGFGVGAVRAAGARIVAFSWIQPAGACARVGIALAEDDKAAGRVGIAIVPAGSSAILCDGEVGTWFWIVAETGDEGGCAGWGCRGGGWRWSCCSENWQSAQQGD